MEYIAGVIALSMIQLLGGGNFEETEMIYDADQAYVLPIEGLEWGMSLDQIEEFVQLSKETEELEESSEVSSGIYYYSLCESQNIYGCDSEITLVLEADYGLVAVQGQCMDAAEFEWTLDELLTGYRSDYNPDKEYAYWELDKVYERYEETDVEQLLTDIYGEEFDMEGVLPGLMNSPLTSYKLYIDGEREGFWEIDASTMVHMRAIDGIEQGAAEQAAVEQEVTG